MSVLQVPDWLLILVRKWGERLLSNEWSIEVFMGLAPNDNPNAGACCEQRPMVNEADLTFRVGLDDDSVTHEMVIHEIVHVAHARVDHVVEDVIIAMLPEGQREMALKAYKAVNEPFTDSMARRLYEIEQELQGEDDAQVRDLVRTGEPSSSNGAG